MRDVLGTPELFASLNCSALKYNLKCMRILKLLIIFSFLVFQKILLLFVCLHRFVLLRKFVGFASNLLQHHAF